MPKINRQVSIVAEAEQVSRSDELLSELSNKYVMENKWTPVKIYRMEDVLGDKGFFLKCDANKQKTKLQTWKLRELQCNMSPAKDDVVNQRKACLKYLNI
jgi:hypothetical protein